MNNVEILLVVKLTNSKIIVFLYFFFPTRSNISVSSKFKIIKMKSNFNWESCHLSCFWWVSLQTGVKIHKSLREQWLSYLLFIAINNQCHQQSTIDKYIIGIIIIINISAYNYCAPYQTEHKKEQEVCIGKTVDLIEFTKII